MAAILPVQSRVGLCSSLRHFQGGYEHGCHFTCQSRVGLCSSLQHFQGGYEHGCHFTCQSRAGVVVSNAFKVDKSMAAILPASLAQA